MFPRLINLWSLQRKKEMREALGRALNCWEKYPKWIQDLYDELSAAIDKAK